MLTISCDGTENMTVSASGVQKQYNIVYELSHIHELSTNPSTMSIDDSITLRFNVDTGYRMPDIATVNGAKSFSYDKPNKFLLKCSLPSMFSLDVLHLYVP